MITLGSHIPRIHTLAIGDGEKASDLAYTEASRRQAKASHQEHDHHEHRHRNGQGSARRDIFRTREGHLLVNRQEIRAVQRRIELWRLQVMARRNDEAGPHRADRRRARHRGRHRGRHLHGGAREASAPYPVHRPGKRDARRGTSALRRRGRMRRARRFRGGRRAEHPLCGRELRRPHHGIRHP